MKEGYTEKSYLPQDDDMALINKFTRRLFEKDEMYTFSLVLCNNDVDRDWEKFSVSALNQMAELFVGKTGIFDHSMKSGDQTARIYKAYVEKDSGKTTADGEEYVCLKAKAYMVRSKENENLIEEIDAGIKKEVSVSCAVKSACCSICGKDRRSQGCEHIPGKNYGAKTAFSILENVTDAYEWSFVAVPAQPKAGVIKSFKKEEGHFDMEKTLKSLLESNNDITLTKSQVNGIASYVKNLEEKAELGTKYKEKLVCDVVRLCAHNLPLMDLKTFEGVANVMTVNELCQFKKAFEGMNKSENIVPQLAKSNKDNKRNNNQFLI